MIDPLKDPIEQIELLEILRNHGYGKFIDLLIEHSDQCYTAKGRINKSGACRVLGFKPRELDEYLAACHEILRELV